MEFTEFGKENKKTMLLLPGTCCSWQVNFGRVLDELKKHYHLICVNYDGFDGSKNDFSDMLAITAKIENCILEKYEKRYRQHFRNPDIHELDMQHEAWMFDKEWEVPVLRVIEECMEGK